MEKPKTTPKMRYGKEHIIRLIINYRGGGEKIIYFTLFLFSQREYQKNKIYLIISL